MSGDDKLLAIFLITMFMGFMGSLVAGWPALFLASVAIATVAFSKSGSK
jgi:hypothetical protein